MYGKSPASLEASPTAPGRAVSRFAFGTTVLGTTVLGTPFEGRFTPFTVRFTPFPTPFTPFLVPFTPFWVRFTVKATGKGV